MNPILLKSLRRGPFWPCALLLGPVLSGCGGGGGMAPVTSTLAPAAKITLSGTLLDTAGVPLVGYRITYAPAVAAGHALRAQGVGGTFSALTDGQGRYSLSVPVSDATPGSTLFVNDPGGTQVQSQTITLDPSQPVQTTVMTLTPSAGSSWPGAPPAPPAMPA